MRRSVLRRHIWGYSVCLCSIKGAPGLNELIFLFLFVAGLGEIKKESKKLKYSVEVQHVVSALFSSIMTL